MTKNTASSGRDQRSARFIRSSESGLTLQNSVPSIMHTSSGEKPTFTPPTLNLREESATVSSTKAMVIEVRLVLEWNIVSSLVSRKPAAAPSSSEQTISTSGSTIMESRFTCPDLSARAMPKETAKTIRPTASSSATMGSSKPVSSPCALYCRTTINVAAGAVAAAMAPRVIAAGAESRSGRAQWNASSARSTSALATHACTTPMISAARPVFFSDSRRNSLPMANAMKPMATLERTLSAATSS